VVQGLATTRSRLDATGSFIDENVFHSMIWLYGPAKIHLGFSGCSRKSVLFRCTIGLVVHILAHPKIHADVK
jgi:hypothetical protein